MEDFRQGEGRRVITYWRRFTGKKRAVESFHKRKRQWVKL